MIKTIDTILVMSIDNIITSAVLFAIMEFFPVAVCIDSVKTKDKTTAAVSAVVGLASLGCWMAVIAKNFLY